MTSQSSPGAAPAPAQTAGALVRVISFSTETTSIDTSSIPADQFEIPAGWRLKPQQPGTNAAAPKCPGASK